MSDTSSDYDNGILYIEFENEFVRVLKERIHLFHIMKDLPEVDMTQFITHLEKVTLKYCGNLKEIGLIKTQNTLAIKARKTLMCFLDTLYKPITNFERSQLDKEVEHCRNKEYILFNQIRDLIKKHSLGKKLKCKPIFTYPKNIYG